MGIFFHHPCLKINRHCAIKKQTITMEAMRQRISDLLDALVGCGKTLVYDI